MFIEIEKSNGSGTVTINTDHIVAIFKQSDPSLIDPYSISLSDETGLRITKEDYEKITKTLCAIGRPPIHIKDKDMLEQKREEWLGFYPTII